MKALMKSQKKPGLWMEEVPCPLIDQQSVLIKVHKASICGTDLHIWNWDKWAQNTIPVPLIVGHEFMGEIVEVGKMVKELKIGARVSGEGHLTCGLCQNCQSGKKHHCVKPFGIGVHVAGCFAEYISLPASNVFPLPDQISDSLGAIFDPLGNATHTALSFDIVGEDVLITGAGPIGMMAAAIAKHAGARHVVITDINDYRLKLALELGATSAINVAKESLERKTKELGIEFGYTVGMEMSGNAEAFSSLLELMQNGGKVALLGILPPHTAIDWNLVIFKMLQIKGIYGREILSTWYKMSHLLESGLKLDSLITHHFLFEDYQKAFEMAISGRSGKILLDFGL